MPWIYMIFVAHHHMPWLSTDQLSYQVCYVVGCFVLPKKCICHIFSDKCYCFQETRPWFIMNACIRQSFPLSLMWYNLITFFCLQNGMTIGSDYNIGLLADLHLFKRICLLPVTWHWRNICIHDKCALLHYSC